MATNRPRPLRLRNRHYVLLCLLLLVLCLLAVFWAERQHRQDGAAVAIYEDGVLVQRIAFDSLSAPYDLVLAGNTLRIWPEGSIEMIAATCPDQLCVQRGRVSSTLYPIICLPHRLEVRIEDTPQEEGGGIDGISG